MVRFGRAYPENRTSKPLFPVVQFDATGAGNHTATASPSYTHTLGTKASAIVVAAALSNTSGPGLITITSAKVGSTNLTLLNSNFLGSYNISGTNVWLSMFLWGLLQPPTGSQTVALSTNASFANVNSVSYTGVTGFGTSVLSSGTSTSMALSVTSQATQMVSMAFTSETQLSQSYSSFNQTQRYNVAIVALTNPGLLIGDAPGSASVSFTATQTASVLYNGMGVPLL